MSSREKVFQDAEKCITNAQKKQKETYDRKHQQLILVLEKRCYLRTLLKSKEKVASWSLHGGVLHSEQMHRKGLYELSKGDRVVKNKANIGQLKLYKKRALDSCEDDGKGMCLLPRKVREVHIIVVWLYYNA